MQNYKKKTRKMSMQLASIKISVRADETDTVVKLFLKIAMVPKYEFTFTKSKGSLSHTNHNNNIHTIPISGGNILWFCDCLGPAGQPPQAQLNVGKMSRRAKAQGSNTCFGCRTTQVQFLVESLARRIPGPNAGESLSETLERTAR